MSTQHKSSWSSKSERARLRRRIRLQLQPTSQTTAVLQHISDMYGVLNRPCRYTSLDHYQHVRKEKAFWGQYKAELRAIERLREKQFIQVEKRKEGYFVALSSEGRVELLKLRIRACTKRLPAGCQCLVLFDIPETASDVRLDFRQFMRRCEFTMTQKSAWSSSCDVAEEMQTLVRLLGIEDWVRIFVARQVP